MLSAQAAASEGYARSIAPIRTDRTTEYEAIGQITRNLDAAMANKGKDFSKLAEAIHRNRSLWTVLAANVADTNNALPEDLRARLLSLAEFVNRHSRAVLSQNADGGILVEINTAIMHGLDNRSRS